MHHGRVHEHAMQAITIGSSLLLLSSSSSGTVSSVSLMVSLVLCSGALGALLATYPTRKR